MDTPLILAIAFLTATVANIVDWAVTRRAAFLWFPSGRVWIACLAAIVATAIGGLLKWIPPSMMSLVGVPPFIFLQLGSIWMRHASPTAVA